MLADLDRLSALAEEAVAEQEEARGGQIWSVREARPRPAAPSLAEAITDPAKLVLAAALDDVVLGYAVASVEPLRDGTLLGKVDDLYVEAEGRAVGLGEELIDQVVAWCASQRCVGVDAFVLPGNRETKNFFETFHFTARALVVHRRLP